jgi:hypothetical protein
MSINDFMNKIKEKIDIDKMTVLYLFIIVGVGIGSFGLGRISVNNNPNKDTNIAIKQTEGLPENKDTKDTNIPTSQTQTAERVYVASKNGKMYYTIGCGGAKRIKPENEVWFSTKEDAEKSGYTLSLTCK